MRKLSISAAAFGLIFTAVMPAMAADTHHKNAPISAKRQLVAGHHMSHARPIAQKTGHPKSTSKKVAGVHIPDLSGTTKP